MQMQELALKRRRTERKAAKDASDAELRKMEIDNTKEIEMGRLEIEGHRLGAKLAYEKDKLDRESNFLELKLV